MVEPPSPGRAGRPDGAPATSPSLAEQPHDSCVRCGRPTPLGVSLCAADNPGGIGAPSSTQVHGTIIVGVLAGLLLFAIAARFAISSSGPFDAQLTSRTSGADGSVELVVDVTNRGAGQAAASCRVAPGAFASTGVSFLTGPLRPGETRSYSQRLGAPAPGEESYAAGTLTVRCT